MIHPKVPTKVKYFFFFFFRNICSYMRCPKNGNYASVLLQRFLNFKPFFGPFLGTIVNTLTHKKVAPGINIIFRISQKILALIWVP